MSETVISVENLSKSYLVGHRSTQRRQQTTLRDAITREVKDFTRNAVGLIRGQQIVQGDTIEEFWALRNLSFDVRRGEVVGVIGRNGTGKSTLLKILSRITEPTEGRITLRGRVASLLEVGTGFHPELSGRENIFLNGAILGMTKWEISKKFDEIVAFAGVETFLDTPVKRYSSGMYVRLAFAVAAHLEPEILLVDEVLAVGDFEFQKKCLGKMEGVVKEGRTVLFVSHQISAINQLCRRIIWLDNGRRVDYGETSSILPKYLSTGLSELPTVEIAEPRGTHDMFFTKISVLDRFGKPSSDLDVQFPFYVCLHYQVLKRVTKVEMAVRIKTIDGTSVFTTVYSDSSDLSKMDKVPGYYAASVQIPGHFLMPGRYTISVHAFQPGLHFRLLQVLDNVLRFVIYETGTKVAKYNDHKNIGVVLVDFPWSDETLLGAEDQSRDSPASFGEVNGLVVRKHSTVPQTNFQRNNNHW